MRIRIPNFRENPANFFRRVGYVFVKREENDMSFIRILAKSGYPRFHVFAHIEKGDLVINIHLDQKRETYGEAKRHHGEYGNGGILKEEVNRIKKSVSF